MANITTGQRGEQVRRLQQDLERLGFDCGPLDGVFGRKTLAAVRAFQSSRGLVVDGVVGPRTSAALDAALAETDATGTGPSEPDDEDDLPGGGDPPETPSTFPRYFDNWDGELARRYRERVYQHESSGTWLDWTGRPGDVDLSQRTHVCCHITAVTFGTSASRRRAWLTRVEQGEISPETLAAYGYDAANPTACATRMALHERFWKVAYHWVGLLNGDILFNNAPSRYTYHGNRSNRFALGVSAEAVLPGREAGRTSSHTAVTESFIETNRLTLRYAITTARDLGAPIQHATAHRCFSMQREGDPGEAYWKNVAIPVCRDLDVDIDYELVDGGRPIPRDWDPGSPFDWKGTRLP